MISTFFTGLADGILKIEKRGEKGMEEEVMNTESIRAKGISYYR